VVEQGRAADGPVSVARDGRSPVADGTPLLVARRVMMRAGVTVGEGKRRRAKVTFHELRHTAATIMLTNASSKITAFVYEHLLGDALLDRHV
jgi:integrase